MLAAVIPAPVLGRGSNSADASWGAPERLLRLTAFSCDQGDDDLLTVYIGEIFLEFVNMLPAFQTYCLQQSTSVNMLNTLEKEKELLRYSSPGGGCSGSRFCFAWCHS